MPTGQRRHDGEGTTYALVGIVVRDRVAVLVEERDRVEARDAERRDGAVD